MQYRQRMSNSQQASLMQPCLHGDIKGPFRKVVVLYPYAFQHSGFVVTMPKCHELSLFWGYQSCWDLFEKSNWRNELKINLIVYRLFLLLDLNCTLPFFPPPLISQLAFTIHLESNSSRTLQVLKSIITSQISGLDLLYSTSRCNFGHRASIMHQCHRMLVRG